MSSIDHTSPSRSCEDSECAREITSTCASCSTEIGTNGRKKRLICSGCSRTPYCSVECQKMHWKEHRSSCKAYQTGQIGYLSMKDMQTIVMALGESTLVGAACCAFRLDIKENRARLSNEVLVVKLKADPSWKMGEPRRIMLDSAETVPFASTQYADGLGKMYAHANASGRARTPPAANTMITMVTYGSQLAAPYASSADDDWFSQIPEYSDDWKKGLDEELKSIVLDQPVVAAVGGKE